MNHTHTHTHTRRPTGLAPWHDAIIISRDVLTGMFTRGQINQVRQVKYYRGADKSLAWPGRKQAYVSVRMAWISFGTLPCGGGGLYDSSRLDVVEITRPWHASKLVSFLDGLRTYQHPGTCQTKGSPLYSRLEGGCDASIITLDHNMHKLLENTDCWTNFTPFWII